MKATVVVFASLLLVVAVPFMPAESDAGSGYECADGTVYSYDTYGSAHPNYRSTITSIETDLDVLYIATVLEGYDVTEIASGALSSDVVRVIVIPENVRTIESGAFSGCAALTDVYFLGDRPELDGAFPDGTIFHCVPGSSGWGSDVSEAVTETVAYGGSSVDYLLIECEWMAVGGTPSDDGVLTLVAEIDGLSVTSVGPYAFAGEMQSDGEVAVRCDIIAAVIPEGIETVRERAFYYCTGLESVSMPATLVSIMDEAFRMAQSLASADLPEGLSYIGFEAYRDCHSLVSVDVPDSVSFMGDGVFYICSSMTSASLGTSVAAVPARAFGYSENLESVEFRGDVESVGQGAFYLTKLTSVELDGVEVIGAEAFAYCDSLSDVDFGDSLISVGQSAFSTCVSLTSVSLPASLESLGSRAFSYCTSLTDVYFAGDMPEIGSGAFLGADVLVHYTEAHADSWSTYDGRSMMDSDSGASLFLLSIVVAIVAVTVVVVLRIRRSRIARRRVCRGISPNP